jgi:hypothetical protein
MYCSIVTIADDACRLESNSLETRLSTVASAAVDTDASLEGKLSNLEYNDELTVAAAQPLMLFNQRCNCLAQHNSLNYHNISCFRGHHSQRVATRHCNREVSVVWQMYNGL